MTGHVEDAALIELLDGGAGTGDGALHAASCEACAARLADLQGLVDIARTVEVPEPPAAFWDAFRRNVRLRLSEERPRQSWRVWLLPAALTAAAALAVVAVETGVGTTRISRTAQATVPAWSALPPADQDEALPVLEGLASSGGATAWIAEPGLAPFVASLTEEESRALTEALRGGGQEVKL